MKLRQKNEYKSNTKEKKKGIKRHNRKGSRIQKKRSKEIKTKQVNNKKKNTKTTLIKQRTEKKDKKNENENIKDELIVGFHPQVIWMETDIQRIQQIVPHIPRQVIQHILHKTEPIYASNGVGGKNWIRNIDQAIKFIRVTFIERKKDPITWLKYNSNHSFIKYYHKPDHLITMLPDNLHEEYCMDTVIQME